MKCGAEMLEEDVLLRQSAVMGHGVGGVEGSGAPWCKASTGTCGEGCYQALLKRRITHTGEE